MIVHAHPYSVVLMQQDLYLQVQGMSVDEIAGLIIGDVGSKVSAKETHAVRERGMRKNKTDLRSRTNE